MFYKTFDKIEILPNNKFCFHYVSFLYDNSNKNNVIGLDKSFLNRNIYIAISDFENSNIFSYEKIIAKKLFIKNVVNLPIKGYKNRIHLYVFYLTSGNIFYNNLSEVYTLNRVNNLYVRDNNKSVIIKEYKCSNKSFDIEYNSDVQIFFKNECENNNILIKNNEELNIYILDRFIIKYFIDNSGLNLNYFKDIISFYDLYNLHFNIINGCNVILIAKNDWSNTAYRFTKSLKEIGVRMSFIKFERHAFNYRFQGIILDKKNKIIKKNPVVYDFGDIDNFFINLCDNFNYIWFHASQIPSINKKIIPYYLKNKKYFVSHGGTTYRERMSIVSKYFNSFCNNTLIQCPDLLKGFSNNENLIYYPVDVNFIKPDFSFKNNSKLVISHYPSTKSTKGSDIIIPVLNKYSDKMILKCCSGKKGNETRVSWEKNIKRYKECDIYVETVKPLLNKKDYGEWGNTCLEAAASGCIVLTNCTHLDLYIKNYKNTPPILICNDALELENNIIKLLNMSREEILELKKKFRTWCEQYHNFKITGDKIKNLFLKI